MKKILTTPIRSEDLKDIRIGDIIYISGTIVTCRDVAHRRGLIVIDRDLNYTMPTHQGVTL